MKVFVPDTVTSLQEWVQAGIFGAGEVHFAEWVLRSSGTSDPLVALGAAMASWAAQRGHSCVQLGSLAVVVAAETAEDAGDGSDATVAGPAWPAADEWLAALRAAAHGGGPVRVVDAWDSADVLDQAPLVLRGDWLYLQRYWVDECKVAASLRLRATDTGEALCAPATALLDRLLPLQDADGARNQQRLAAELVVSKRLALVAGGPGTGKTYSVARLLAVLIANAQATGEPLRIALAAPTGKAAARLRETILAALAPRDGEEAIDDATSESLRNIAPSTIHRLLGSLGPNRQRFRHDAAHPLPHDVVVIDETSMVSLPLLSRLVEAVRPEARLVLIGDPDQLESVELGAVLGDLVKAAETTGSPLAGHAVRLLRSHRVATGSSIALLADAVRAGDADLAVARLGSDATALNVDPSVRFVHSDDPRTGAGATAIRGVMEFVLTEVRDHAEAGEAKEALAASARARMLCAHRQGPWGVSEWNERAESWMRGATAAPGIWYPGRPLLVTRNDVRLGLANGDTGVVVRRAGRLVAVFHGPDQEHPLEFDPVQLEDVSTAYAMTIHKSQGSEYATVVLVLPPTTSPLAGRELVYTGITRAKDRLVVVGSEESLRRCVDTPARRMTGLAAALV